jgi:nucleoside 2-deoxyribosyltransferase
MTKCGLKCERADDFFGTDRIMQSIRENINRARLIVAEITGRRANVLYELGIAHTLEKPVIMITQSKNDIPFDLIHLRYIVYKYKPQKIDKFEGNLERTIRIVLDSTS